MVAQSSFSGLTSVMDFNNLMKVLLHLLLLLLGLGAIWLSQFEPQPEGFHFRADEICVL